MGWFSRRAEEQVAIVADRQGRIEEDLRRTAQEMSALTAALVVREPATATAAQAYDGLRKAVMAGAQARRELLVNLVELTELLDHDVDIEDVRSLVEELRLRAHLVQDVDVAARPAHFTVLDGVGDSVRVNKVAWVDEQTGALIKRGLAERVTSQRRALPEAQREVAEAVEADPLPADTQSPRSPGAEGKPSAVQGAPIEVPSPDVHTDKSVPPVPSPSQASPHEQSLDPDGGSFRGSPTSGPDQAQATLSGDETDQVAGASAAGEDSGTTSTQIETTNEDGRDK